MASLFDIKCKNCGTPVGYDVVRQTYRCPSCGQTSGIREVRAQAGYRRMDAADRKHIETSAEIASCPNCGAEVLYGVGEESETCSFCGGRLVRREFEASDQFPQYILPFTLTRQEAQAQLQQWAQANPGEGRQILEHLQELEGWYLPYSLVRGPVWGFVRRENSTRDFHVRAFVDRAVVNVSRQLDNETLDAAEPFDLSQLRPFEHGYIAGHKVKLADLSGAKRQRRCLQEAGNSLRPAMEKKFGTDGVRIHLVQGELLEIPVLLPMYLLKMGRRLVAVNGQTGRISMKTEEAKKRSRLWIVEPLMLAVLLFLAMWLGTRSLIAAAMWALVFGMILLILYSQNRYSVIGRVIRQSEQTKAQRVAEELRIREDAAIPRNPFPTPPVFFENLGGQLVDVVYKFYPFRRILEITGKMLFVFFLPVIVSGLLYLYLCGVGSGFRLLGGSAWYLLSSILCMIYMRSGVRGDTYDLPYTYVRTSDGKRKLLPGSRRIPFLRSLGVSRGVYQDMAQQGKTPAQITMLFVGTVGLAIVSILGILL